MWPKSSSVKAVNLVEKSATILEIYNFPRGLFLACPVHQTHAKSTQVRLGLRESTCLHHVFFPDGCSKLDAFPDTQRCVKALKAEMNHPTI